jgi:hypothetical protein
MRISDLLTETYEFIIESPADDIIDHLKNLGFASPIRDSGNRVILRVTGDRKQVIRDLVNQLPGSKHNPSAGSSSLGGIEFRGGLIVVSPAGKSGNESAGLKNEQHLINKINEFVKQYGPLEVTFVGDNKKRVTAYNVTEARGTGKDTGDRKKSDMHLISDQTIVPISIKKRNAEYWESADSLFGKQADEIVDKLVAAEKVQLIPIDKFRLKDNTQMVHISPEVAIKATPEQTEAVVFGKDILAGNGAVVKETFEDEHYTLRGNKLFVTCDLVILEPEDIPSNLQVYFIIRNGKDRNRPGSKYPGLRVLATYASRVKNAMMVDPENISAAVAPTKSVRSKANKPIATDPTPALNVSKPQMGQSPV